MLSYLSNKYLIWSAKRFARGASRAMLLSCEMYKNKNVDVKYFSDYAKLTILLRPGWTKLSDVYFEHKSGIGITIENEDSIKHVTKKIVEVEMMAATSGNINSNELVKIALEEIDKYYLRK